MLRLPATHTRSLICFASRLHVILHNPCLASCAPGRTEAPPRPGSLFTGDPKLPVCSHVDVNGISQVPRRSVLCLCPALRPRPNRRPLASLTVSSMLPSRFPRRRLQRLWISGLNHAASAPAAYASRMVLPPPHAKLASGWLARLYREGVEPSGSLQKVSDCSLILLFWIYPGAREVSS